MKKTKIISLIFVCAFLVLTFCCSFAGKIVDVEVKPPLCALSTNFAVGDIFVVDLSSYSLDDGYTWGYFALNRGGSPNVINVYDSDINLLGTYDSLNFGTSATISTPSIFRSGSTILYSGSGLFYIELVSTTYLSGLYFVSEGNSNIVFGGTQATLPVRSGVSVLKELPPPPPPDFTPAEFYDLVLMGITSTAEDISVVFDNLAQSLFLRDTNSLSHFSIILFVMLGVSITLGLCNLVLDYILTLGRKKR